jgi:hypothetical protein
LAFLILDDTEVTDEGLEQLQALPRLTWLKLTKTLVTADGVAKLKLALPSLKIDN